MQRYGWTAILTLVMACGGDGADSTDKGVDTGLATVTEPPTEETTVTPCDPVNGDVDGDAISDGCDNCPALANPSQTDTDGDSTGDDCDSCPLDANDDSDGDGSCDSVDLCPGSDDAADVDADGVPDDCDICDGFPDATDTDADGVADGCDVCAGFDDAVDTDADGTADGCDVCDGFDDTFDADGDLVPDACDSCPMSFDPADADTDSDGVGDVCDNCPDVLNDLQTDTDSDGVGDACDNCPDDANPIQDDGDTDTVGDACDICLLGDDNLDNDGDGVPNACDNCQSLSDSDGDGIVDDCDVCPLGDDNVDGDGDDVPDACDICPGVPDADTDLDGAFCDVDCDDNDPLNAPGFIEDCADGGDNDCDGLVDCLDSDCASDPGCSTCGNGAVDGSEQCDDGNQCLYDGCSDNVTGAVDECTFEQSLVFTAMEIGAGATGFDLDGDGTIDNVLGGNGILAGELNTALSDALNDGSLAQALTLGDLDNVPYSGTGIAGYSDDPDAVLSMYDTVDPNCLATLPPPWITGPWPVDLYSDSDDWDLVACTGPAIITDADNAANGIYPTGGGQLANPPPAAPYLQQQTNVISLPFGDTTLDLYRGKLEATVTNDGTQIDGLINGVLGGALPGGTLWSLVVGGDCPTALHAVLALGTNADIDLDGGGIEPMGVSCTGGFFGCIIPCFGASWTLDACVDDTGTVIPDTDVNGDGLVGDGECYLDPRMADGFSAGIAFTADPINITSQVSDTTFCP
ncbi:MAG: hypothetical protein GWP91_16780 [Rhodobacterales bacterium]|nr:hypothetical protein [Rhodobacterales bacterium]